METEYETVLDVKMEDERHVRYQRLHAIVHDINSNSLVRTSEWYAEHNALLHYYDEYFRSGFSELNPEFTDEQFRSNCCLLDKLIHKLMGEYERYQWFGVYDYKRFNEIAIQVADYVTENTNETEDTNETENTNETEDDLSMMFNSLSV